MFLDDSHNHDKNPGQMNINGAFLHVLGDTFGSVIVVICASLIIWIKWEYIKYVDSAMSIISVIIISSVTFPLGN